MTKRQQQAAETRQLIIDTTQQLLRSLSVEQLTVARITQECGIAKGTFYVHFKTKDDLLIRILYDMMDPTLMELQADKSLTLRQRLDTYIRHQARSLAGGDDATPALVQHLLAYRMTQAYREMRDGHYGYLPNHEFKIVRSFLTEAVEKGELKPDTPCDRLARIILYTMYGAYLQGGLWSNLDLIRDWGTEFAEHVCEDILAPWLV